MGAEAVFTLPLNRVGAFSKLFATLEADAATLGVQHYGISVHFVLGGR